MGLLILYLALALGVSFLCSVLEAVLLSVTPSYIAAEQEKSRHNGYRWQSIKKDIDRALAAILSLNTIAHTVGAAGVGAQAGKVFGEAYFGVISAVLTLLILVISEIIPKTLGANYWRQLAPSCGRLLRIVELSMLPLVVLAQGITRLFAGDKSGHTVSREEIAALAWAGENQGVLTREESAVIRSIVRFRSLTARDIMTPRTVIFSLSENLPVTEALAHAAIYKFSRIPIYSGDPDNIRAFVRKDEILAAVAQGNGDQPLVQLRRPLISVLDNSPLLPLVRNMSMNHYQQILVVNEYGDLLGLITMEDLVETMLGLEIVDETDSHPDMRKLARKLWERRSQQSGPQSPQN